MQATMAGKTSGNCYFGHQLGDFEVLHTSEVFVESKIFIAVVRKLNFGQVTCDQLQFIHHKL